MKKEYLYYQTFFDIEQYRKAIILLKHEDIDFKVVDKSNQANFRVPMSTYIEIDLLVNKKDIDRIDKILTGLNE